MLMISWNWTLCCPALVRAWEAVGVRRALGISQYASL